jgi:type VI secretion system protein ImpH
MLGKRVWGCQHRFRITIGPLDFGDYQRLLPVGDRIRRLVALVRNYIGDELAWDVRLILKREAVPPLRLDNRSRLGWTTWLGNRSINSDADDLTVKVSGFVTQPTKGRTT